MNLRNCKQGVDSQRELGVVCKEAQSLLENAFQPLLSEYVLLGQSQKTFDCCHPYKVHRVFDVKLQDWNDFVHEMFLGDKGQ